MGLDGNNSIYTCQFAQIIRSKSLNVMRRAVGVDKSP